MKILIVSQYFWPENFRVNELATGFVKRGHRVTVLTGIPNYPQGRFYKGYGLFKSRREDYRGVRILRVPLIPRGKAGSIGLILNYLSFIVSSCALILFYCREKYDVIFVSATSPITMALPAILLKKLKTIPIFLWVLDLWPESVRATGDITSPRVLKVLGRVVRYIYSRCDRILVPARGYYQSVMEMGIEKSRIRYFPNWVEESGEVISELKPDPRWNFLGFQIVFAGNIGDAQDFPTILTTVEKLSAEYPDIHWIIVGDGRKRVWVEKEVATRGLAANVHLPGRFPLEEMSQIFASADLLLATLRKDPIFSLTIPGKLQSYMAAGKPIVAALDGEGGELITESGAGLVCPSGDPEALAGIIRDIYNSSQEERDKIGRMGKEYCEAHFDRDQLFDKLEEWMVELI